MEKIELIQTVLTLAGGAIGMKSIEWVYSAITLRRRIRMSANEEKRDTTETLGADFKLAQEMAIALRTLQTEATSLMGQLRQQETHRVEDARKIGELERMIMEREAELERLKQKINELDNEIKNMREKCQCPD